MKTAAARMRSLVAAAPLLILGASVVNAPYVTAVREVAARPQPLTMQPYLLYRHEHTSFFYTSGDLIHPEAFGRPGEFIDAVLFDVYPSGPDAQGSRPDDPDSTSNSELTWVSRFWKAIAGGPAPTSSDDLDLASRFRGEIGGLPHEPRGGVILFELPPPSSYRRASGVRQLAALATRPAGEAGSDSFQIAERGSLQLFNEALDNAFDELRRRDVRSVGVPRMIVRDRIGDDGSRAASWQTIITRADGAARNNGMDRVLFGGWGIDPIGRQATDAAFGDVWEQQRRVLARQTRVIVHERWRVGALIAFAALVRWTVKRRTVQWRRLVALAGVTSGMALTIATAEQWLAASVAAPIVFIFLVECIAAVAAGAVIEQIVQFDFRKQVAEDGMEKPV